MAVSRFLSWLVSAAVVSLAAGQAQSQQVLSAIDSELIDGSELKTNSTVAGRLVTFDDVGSSVKVITNYGVNKLYASASGGHEQAATSAWMDTYRADGPAGSKVKLSFSFTIDGSANFGTQVPENDPPGYGFKVFAMRGTGWTMHAHDDERPDSDYSPLFAGEDIDKMFLQRVRAQGIEQLDMTTNGRVMLNFANASGQPGGFGSQVSYVEGDDLFKVVTGNPNNGQLSGSYFYDTHFRSGGPQNPVSPPIFYNAGTPQANNLANTRNNLERNFSILDKDELCNQDAGTCTERVWDPTKVIVDFEVLAGESFTLAAWMYADEVSYSTIDFFNTAKMSGVTATSDIGGPVSLSSSSGQLVANGSGGFGYVAAGVPEPAIWAMLIGGFGFVGAASRRRAAPQGIHA